MDRFCFFHVPQVQLVPQARGVGQITYRPKVEDDDFCQEFKSKTSRKDANDLFDELTGQAESPKPSISTNSSGGSTGVPV
jgi:hypothetical protein